MCAQNRSWNSAERAEVAELLASGRSLGRISKLLGMTRNAVIGRIHRDGELHAFVGARVVMKQVEKKRKRPVKEHKIRAPAHTIAVEPVQNHVEEHRLPPPVDDLPIEIVTRPSGKLLYELGSTECRWPVDEHESVIGGFIFCAEPKEGERAYCPKHARLAYTGTHYQRDERARRRLG